MSRPAVDAVSWPSILTALGQHDDCLKVRTPSPQHVWKHRAQRRGAQTEVSLDNPCMLALYQHPHLSASALAGDSAYTTARVARTGPRAACMPTRLALSAPSHRANTPASPPALAPALARCRCRTAACCCTCAARASATSQHTGLDAHSERSRQRCPPALHHADVFVNCVWHM
jgi:hypothetical protein